jgi:hypothetical protein
MHWGRGGTTDVDNLVSLCRPHHRAVHEQRWRIHIASGIAVVEAISRTSSSRADGG